MNDDTGAEYLSPWRLDECIDGGGVGVVEASKNESLAIGDIVTSFNWHWETHDVIDGNLLQKVFVILGAVLRISRHEYFLCNCVTDLPCLVGQPQHD